MSSDSKNKVRSIKSSSRAAIIDLLCMCEQGAFANDIVPSRLSNSDFSDSDRALITKVVYSTLRQQIRIDAALEKISSRPLKKLDSTARNAIRAIACQVVEGMSAHAVVNETIKVIPFSMKGFVNAIARKIIALHSENKFFVGESFAQEKALPSWIVDEIEKIFPKDKAAVADALNVPSGVTLAPLHNPLDESVGEEGALVPQARVIHSGRSVGSLEQIKNGEALVADQGSQFVVQCVQPQPDDTILDVCAAPGGKSVMLAFQCSRVTANDITESRMEKLKDTMSRVQCENIDIVISDARNLEIDEDKKFDRVLVDAPCSGLGVLRRRPDARHRITPDNVAELVELQKEILTSAMARVKPGGYLIYSVCTFTSEETSDIDRWLQKNSPEWVAQDIDVTSELVIPQGRGVQIMPTATNDAMFVLRLRKP